jgi:hypothetical protein
MPGPWISRPGQYPGEEAKPILWDKTPAKTKTISQFGKGQKIKLKKVKNSQPSTKAVFPPRFTTHSPRFHHQKTTFKHPLFPKPPAKTPAKREKSHAVTSAGFFSKFFKNEAKHSA